MGGTAAGSVSQGGRLSSSEGASTEHLFKINALFLSFARGTKKVHNSACLRTWFGGSHNRGRGLVKVFGFNTPQQVLAVPRQLRRT